MNSQNHFLNMNVTYVKHNKMLKRDLYGFKDNNVSNKPMVIIFKFYYYLLGQACIPTSSIKNVH